MRLKSVLVFVILVFLGLIFLNLSTAVVESANPSTVLIDVPYLSQSEASIDPGSSCGPAAVAMALSFATNRPVSVDSVRAQTRHPKGGATYFGDFVDVWPQYGLQLGSTVRMVYTENEFKGALRSGQVIVTALHMGSRWISKGTDYAQETTAPDQNAGLFDPWIQSSGAPYWGHMVVITGYTTQENGPAYFIVNDPDYFNMARYRYSNGAPKGQGRKLAVAEVMQAIEGMWPDPIDNSRSFALAVSPLTR